MLKTVKQSVHKMTSHLQLISGYLYGEISKTVPPRTVDPANTRACRIFPKGFFGSSWRCAAFPVASSYGRGSGQSTNAGGIRNTWEKVSQGNVRVIGINELVNERCGAGAANTA
jgi:hypothetical protein